MLYREDGGTCADKAVGQDEGRDWGPVLTVRLRAPLSHRLSVGRRSSQRCVECSNQLPDTSPTRRCARVAPQDVHYDGRRKNPGLRDLVESDGGIVSGGEFQRSCGMSSRSEDVLDLSSCWQGVEECRTHRVAGRARSVARRSPFRIAGLLSRPVGRPRAVA